MRKREMKKIAIIDDSREFLKLMKHILQEEEVFSHSEISVECYNNGVEFVEHGDFYSYSLIILDVDMPYIQGDNLYKQLLTLGILESVPVLVMSGIAEEDFMANFNAWKNRDDIMILDFVKKPSPIEWIQFKVHQLLKCKELYDNQRAKNVSKGTTMEGGFQ